MNFCHIEFVVKAWFQIYYMVDYARYAVIPQGYNCVDLGLYILISTHSHIYHSRVKDLTHPSLAVFVNCPLLGVLSTLNLPNIQLLIRCDAFSEQIQFDEMING